jgi:hypothetical protein
MSRFFLQTLLAIACLYVFAATGAALAVTLPSTTPAPTAAVDPPLCAQGAEEEEECVSPTYDCSEHDAYSGDIQDAVQEAMDQLTSEGEDLNDLEDEGQNCGPGLIVERVIEILGGSVPDAGLLRKTGGMKCNNHSVDVIAFPDGCIYDVVAAAGDITKHRPAWQNVCCYDNGTDNGDGVCPDRWIP